MASEVSRLIELRDKLSAGDDILETLEGLNTLLESCPSNSEILQISTVIGPQLIFYHLSGGQDPETLHVACAALYKMLIAFPLPQFLKLTQEIELGLQHPAEPVRQLCLKLLNQKTSSSPSFHQIALQSTMFHLITVIIGDTVLSSAQLATNIIETLFNSSPSIFTSPGTLRDAFVLDLRSLVSKSDVIRFRVYTLLVSLSLLSPDFLQFIQEEGFISSLIAELESDDILINLNCLELLQQLAGSDGGLEMIVAADVLKKLHSILEGKDNNPLSSMIVPGNRHNHVHVQVHVMLTDIMSRTCTSLLVHVHTVDYIYVTYVCIHMYI